jgi:succinoglycan biosynthesis transport protein ExoP
MPPNPSQPQNQSSGQAPYGSQGGSYGGSGGYGGYGGGYGGYGGYGYGYPGGGQEGGVQKQFRDYVLILRERIWYIITIFLVIFASTAIFTFTRVKLYQSSANIQILRNDPVVLQVQNVQDNSVRSAEDLNTQVKVLESSLIVQKVAEDLKGAELEAFTAPYKREEGGSVSVTGILTSNRKITTIRSSLIVTIQYTHPDPVIAAKVANYFANEYIAYNARVKVDDSMKAVEDLKERADEQKKKVEQMANALQDYREKNGMISLDQRKDTVTETLKKLNLAYADTTARRTEAEVRLKQMKDLQAAKGDLLTLEFIAGQSNIADLSKQLATQKIAIAQLSQRYRDKHPTMQAAQKQLAETESQMKQALVQATATVESTYQTAVRNDEQAKQALKTAEDESLKLDRYAVAYSNTARDYDINVKLLQTMISRMDETKMTSSIETQNVRIIDVARPGGIIYPATLLNLSLGLVGGLGLGLAVAFFVAYIDDRVKSAYDIEGVVGLPLIGIIPAIDKLERSERAQIADNHLDKRVAEAFFGLHAALQLKNESKNAQCILVTSTVPGEGKSFVSSNLAITFASHGERTVLIDCDLRKPTQHRLLQSDHPKGVIDFCSGASPLDDIIAKNVKPNLDLISSGGRAKSPTQMLNSKTFENMISELRKRYDRIIVDTPPLAAVTDALIVLPLMDASIYSIFFNKVRRKAAQFCAKQMQDANIPCCGAVLNGLNLDISGYYYAQYYDKSYQSYYGESGTKKKKRRSKTPPENNDPDNTPLR